MVENYTINLNWPRFSRFGTPYPPFDFNSGMGVEDVSRDEAVALGLLERNAKLEPNIADFMPSWN